MHIRSLRYGLQRWKRNRNRNQKGIWAGLLSLAFALALTQASCDSGAILILNLEPASVPQTITQYLLRASLNGQPGEEKFIDSAQRRVALRVPAGMLGTVEISVLGVDKEGCRVQLGAVRTEIPTSLNHSSEGTLSLTATGAISCWTSVTTGTTVPLKSVHSSEAENTYVVGAEGTALRCRRSTKECTKLNTGTVSNLNAVWAVDPSSVFIVGDAGYIGVCSADSDSCRPIVVAFMDDYRSVWGSSSTNAYVVGSNGRVLRCSGTTLTCTVVATGIGAVNLYKVFGVDATNVYVAGANGTVLRCVQGSPCTQILTGATDTLLAIGTGDGGSAIVGGGGGSLYYCRNGSLSCGALSGLSTQQYNAVWGPDTSHVYAVGNSGLYTRCASGPPCEGLPPPTMGALFAAWGLSSANTGTYVVGAGGFIGRCDNASMSCPSQSSPSKETLFAIWGTDANNIYIAGDKGTLLRHYP